VNDRPSSPGAGIMMVASSSVVYSARARQGIGHYWGRGLHTTRTGPPSTCGPALLPVRGARSVRPSSRCSPAICSVGRRRELEGGQHAPDLLLGLAVVGVLMIEVFARPLVLLIRPGLPPGRYRPRSVRTSSDCWRRCDLHGRQRALHRDSQAHRHFTAPRWPGPVFNFGVIGGAFAGGLAVNRFPADRRAGDARGRVVIGAILLVVVQYRRWRRAGTASVSPGISPIRGAGDAAAVLPYMAGLAFTQICLLWLPGFSAPISPRWCDESALREPSVVFAARPVRHRHLDRGFPRGRADCGGRDRRVPYAVLGNLACGVLPGCAVCGRAADTGRPIVRLLWRGGQFHENDVAASTFCLVLYAISLIGLSGLQITNRAFYSLRTGAFPASGIGYTIVIVLVAVASCGHDCSTRRSRRPPRLARRWACW